MGLVIGVVSLVAGIWVMVRGQIPLGTREVRGRAVYVVGSLLALALPLELAYIASLGAEVMRDNPGITQEELKDKVLARTADNAAVVWGILLGPPILGCIVAAVGAKPRSTAPGAAMSDGQGQW